MRSRHIFAHFYPGAQAGSVINRGAEKNRGKEVLGQIEEMFGDGLFFEFFSLLSTVYLDLIHFGLSLTGSARSKCERLSQV